MNRHALLQRVSVFGSLNWLKRESAVLRRGWFLGGLVAYSRGSVTVNQKLAGFHEERLLRGRKGQQIRKCGGHRLKARSCSCRMA